MRKATAAAGIATIFGGAALIAAGFERVDFIEETGTFGPRGVCCAVPPDLFVCCAAPPSHRGPEAAQQAPVEAPRPHASRPSGSPQDESPQGG